MSPTTTTLIRCSDELVARAHDVDLRVTVDLVPNHTSDQHEWFQAAVAAGPGSPERSRYLFRDGRGPSGDEQPTDVVSSFSGPAWTRVTEPDGSPGQWYFHLFASEQPDLNWENPEVLAEFERVWRFWLDRGVDGFRVDVADHLTKDISRTDKAEGNQLLEHEPDTRTHQVWRRFRQIFPIERLWGKSGLPVTIKRCTGGRMSFRSCSTFGSSRPAGT